MKKVLLLLILGVSLTSCKKKPCWECRAIHFGNPSDISTTVCDKTEEEIRQYEKNDSSIGGDIVTKCTKK